MLSLASMRAISGSIIREKEEAVAGWVDCKDCKDTWKVIEKVPSGAQGESFFATNNGVVALSSQTTT